MLAPQLTMTLRDDLSDLPDGALVPVGWIRERLAGEPDQDRISDLTVQEVADELDRQPSTVRGWLGSGALDGYKFRGREWRVTRAALRAFLDEEANDNGAESADLGSWRKVVQRE